MKTSIPIAMASPPSEPEDLRTLIETDHRRGSIGLHIASDVTKAARTMTSVWLEPHQVERLALEIQAAAVARWRDDQAATAWASTHHAGGRA